MTTQQQTCKVCGCRDKFNYDVPDSVWNKVVPKKYQNRVVCLACFDDFASEKNVQYEKHIKEIIFAGEKCGMVFKKERPTLHKMLRGGYKKWQNTYLVKKSSLWIL